MKKRADKCNHHFIYKTTCLVTNRYYIGMHSTDDMDDDYFGSGTVLRWSIKKHGKENHRREIIEDCSEKGRAFLRDREAEIVNEEMLKDPLCMNVKPGGGGWITPTHNMMKVGCNLGKKHTEQSRKNMGASHIGKKHSEEAKKKMSERAKEREARKKEQHHIVSEETKAKMSASHMGSKNWFYGKKHTDATRLKMSSKLRGRTSHMLGRKHTEETKRRISQALVGRTNVCFDKNLTYKMIEDAFEPGMSGKELVAKLNTTFMKVVKRLKRAGYSNFSQWSQQRTML